MLFVDTSIIHYSSEGVLILCNILDLLIYSTNTLNHIDKIIGISKIFFISVRIFSLLFNTVSVSLFAKNPYHTLPVDVQ